MEEMIEARKVSEKKPDRHDLFHNLLAAADGEQNPLTDKELFGQSSFRFHDEINV